MLFPILAIVGGLIAASSLLIAKKPDAKELFEKVAPYQGMIGVGMLVLGVLWTLQVLPHLGTLLKAAPVNGIVTIATLAGTILVGFLLGYGLISKFVLSKNEAAQEKGALMLTKIGRVQVPLGLLTAGLAAASIVL
jgi:predicted membrane-bound spermidine synthase